MENTNSLQLVPTEQLFDELVRRYQHAVIIVKKFHKPEADKPQQIEMTFRRWYGHPDMCIGMAFDMQDHINDYKKQNVKPVELKDS